MNEIDSSLLLLLLRDRCKTVICRLSFRLKAGWKTCGRQCRLGFVIKLRPKLEALHTRHDWKSLGQKLRIIYHIKYYEHVKIYVHFFQWKNAHTQCLYPHWVDSFWRKRWTWEKFHYYTMFSHLILLKNRDISCVEIHNFVHILSSWIEKWILSAVLFALTTAEEMKK